MDVKVALRLVSNAAYASNDRQTVKIMKLPCDSLETFALVIALILSVIHYRVIARMFRQNVARLFTIGE